MTMPGQCGYLTVRNNLSTSSPKRPGVSEDGKCAPRLAVVLGMRLYEHRTTERDGRPSGRCGVAFRTMPAGSAYEALCLAPAESTGRPRPKLFLTGTEHLRTPARSRRCTFHRL